MITHTNRGAGRFLLATLALLASCSRLSERTLTDTEGRHFTAKCQRDGTCALSQVSGVKRDDGKGNLALSETGRLLGVCDVVQGGHPDTPADCRALVCQSDADCPPGHGMKNGQCLNGWCADPAQALDSSDSVMLCLAGLGLGRSAPRQVERYALGLNCGSPCKIPAPCRQP